MPIRLSLNLNCLLKIVSLSIKLRQSLKHRTREGTKFFFFLETEFGERKVREIYPPSCKTILYFFGSLNLGLYMIWVWRGQRQRNKREREFAIWREHW